MDRIEELRQDILAHIDRDASFPEDREVSLSLSGKVKMTFLPYRTKDTRRSWAVAEVEISDVVTSEVLFGSSEAMTAASMHGSANLMQSIFFLQSTLKGKVSIALRCEDLRALRPTMTRLSDVIFSFPHPETISPWRVAIGHVQLQS